MTQLELVRLKPDTVSVHLTVNGGDTRYTQEELLRQLDASAPSLIQSLNLEVVEPLTPSAVDSTDHGMEVDQHVRRFFKVKARESQGY